jgi:predicted pyridoxine 5'-phosphate oxidase superfamily flavin-nucleotide-binding protein
MATAELRQHLKDPRRAFAQAVDLAVKGSGDGHERLVLAWQRSLVTLRPDTMPSPVRERFLRLHDRIRGRPPGGDAEDYVATFKALDPKMMPFS